jgi:hypothetical protein
VTSNADNNAAARQFEATRSGSFGRPRTTTSAVGGALPSTAGGPQADNLQSITPRNLRIPGSAGAQTRLEAMSPQEQEVLIEVNRAIIQETGQVMPPLPPTSLTTPQDLRRIVVPPSLPGQ